MTPLLDKDWLHRIVVASEVYKNDIIKYESQKQEIDNFVQWLYKQYGIVMPNNAKE